MSAGRSESFTVGDCLVTPLSNQLSLDDRAVTLRAQVMDLLVYLAGRSGRVVSLEVLHDELWRGKVVSSGTIYNCIAELRQAFAALDPGGDYLDTIPKKGYRLIPAIGVPAQPADTAGATTVIAILPLLNRSTAEDEYLCDGISEEILHSLSRIPSLRVVSALSLKGLHLTNEEIARRFGADFVLTGSLQRSGSRLRLGFRLEDADSGEVLWSGQRVEQFSDIFDVQESVAREVVDALCAQPGLVGLLPDAPGNSGTSDSRALNEFLLGRHAFSVGTAAEYAKAIGHFERSIQLDPSFARAHYCLYLACYFHTRYGGSEPDLIRRARLAAARARECGYRPAVPWAHIHRRLHKEERLGTLDLGREALEKFQSRDPEWRSFAFEQMTWVLSASGLFEAALEFNRRALDSPSLNFQDSDVDEEMPNWAGGAGHLQEAIRSLSNLIQKDPRRAWYRYDRATLFCRTGQFDSAEEELAALAALGAPTRNARIVLAYWRGDPDGVATLVTEARSGYETRPMYECVVQAMAGNLDLAAGLFEQATDTQGDFAYIDLGYMRARLRCSLPAVLVGALESHPLVLRVLEAEGIDEAWCRWLTEQLNAIDTITGIRVRPDDTPPES